MMRAFKILPGFLAPCIFIACSLPLTTKEQELMPSEPFAHTNDLIHETSPYLLQHAHNPVNWKAWNKETLEMAKKENKIMLISIGYSACHWCHVMEHESFEDETVAEYMNNHFVNIKVDREERPDVDQVYMDAVQLMTQGGGWPLNCFATPEGKPFYGGTYFRKDQWLNALKKIHQEWVNNPNNVNEFAEKLTQGIVSMDVVGKTSQDSVDWSKVLTTTIDSWRPRWDNEEGGPNKAPKFPLPNNYMFLLRYAHLTKDDHMKDHVHLTLNKIVKGGIYDQAGGGFARYSTDKLWKVPHFEKMLYDNAQLVSLYSEAFQQSGNPEYENAVRETIAFLQREMKSPEGWYYSALDADSEGEEGKFYVWKEDELKQILEGDFGLFKKYYNVNIKGHWEHGNYILLRDKDLKDFALGNDLDPNEFKQTAERWKGLLLKHRGNRIRPGLDDKSLISWNALMAMGFVDAGVVFNDDSYIREAEKILENIESLKNGESSLFHSYKNGKSKINGMLEDYCFLIEAQIKLYEATFNENLLLRANDYMFYVITHFYDEKSGFFWFTSDEDDPLIARKKEITDNVIPSSNSSLCKSLDYLGRMLDNTAYLKYSERMLNSISSELPKYGSGFSNWGIAALNKVFPSYEVAIMGENSLELLGQFNKNYLPGVYFAGGKKEGKVPFLANKLSEDQNTIYVCKNKSCQFPVELVDDALKQIK